MPAAGKKGNSSALQEKSSAKEKCRKTSKYPKGRKGLDTILGETTTESRLHLKTVKNIARMQSR